MGVEFLGSEHLELARGTFMWVQVTHFSFDAADSARAVLGHPIASPAYDHDYAGPFPADPADAAERPGLHGRWSLGAIKAELFRPVTAAAAIATLARWADEQDWTDPGFRQPTEVLQRLERIYELLRSGEVYQLGDPGPGAMHEYGWVVGELGFHEYAVLDRGARRLHLIVAADD